MRALSIFSFFFFTTFLSWAQHSLTGQVTDEEGLPIEHATIQLRPTAKSLGSEADGSFSFSNLNSGEYQLSISFVGFESFHKTILIQSESLDLGQVILAEQVNDLDQVVVTASRMAQSMDEVPIPVQVIDEQQISESSNLRLNEILAEQTGLLTNSDHGSGIQIQGLNSEYILVLIDGEPMIGRTAGTLDLSRITLNNIKRIEIVKGPSSSLYGSEAMGGVINIITKEPTKGIQLKLSGRHRRFNTNDLNAELSLGNDRLKFSTFYNRLSSDGYDLNENTLSQTVASYVAHTFQTKLQYELSANLEFSVSGRYYEEPQQDQTEIILSNGEENQNVVHEFNANRKDWNLLPKLEWRLKDRALITFRKYLSSYATETRFNRSSDGALYSLDEFKQEFNRTEIQGDFFLNDIHTVTLGVGIVNEGVSSTRYQDSTFQATYLFAQHLWEPTDRFNITSGLRYDRHIAYGENFSPKLALGFEMSSDVRLRASIGVGFKAPDFRQLLLNYNNPTVGYSVIGTAVVTEGVEKLIQEGETFRNDPVNNPNALTSARANAALSAEGLVAERSLSFNLGTDIQLTDQLLLKANFFRNEISNLIETWAVAQKDNGQFVYSYRNLDNIITQGLELESHWQFKNNINISLGYQFLDTYDENIVEKIQSGQLAFRPVGEIISQRVTRRNYGGLFGRSQHSGNLKINYQFKPWKVNIYWRTIYRGAWGFADRDGNQILVGEDEYAPAYYVHNLSLQKKIGEAFLVDLGANNLFNTTNPYEPNLAGTLWFLGLNYTLK